ncbi:6170_t:CDS:2 [Ambispora leptoticha]|uniref:6170_t:CDS:1 n=1 Tax=Ambispora leptoticha TaxID=144679 RepID=A0A9N8VG08_9GLOM|nr:6170_t:CDS:2 [Ambispora leptoticha]
MIARKQHYYNHQISSEYNVNMTNSSMTKEKNDQLPLFRWLLVPLAVFLTLIPSVILSQAKNPNKLVPSSIATKISTNAKIPAGIVLTPSLSFNGDDVFVACIWVITMLGISGLVRQKKIFGQFLAAFLIAFTALQTFLAFCGVFTNNRAIASSLNGAWQRAYENNKDLLKEIQYEFSCKGFASIDDRSVEIPESYDVSCGIVMVQRFGPQLYYVVMMMFISRLIQSIGVFALTYIFQKLIQSSSHNEDPESFTVHYQSEVPELGADGAHDEKSHYNTNIFSGIYRYFVSSTANNGNHQNDGEDDDNEEEEDENLPKLLLVFDIDEDDEEDVDDEIEHDFES